MKGEVGGRTPLGDLSNSLKPSLNQVSKKHNSSILPLYEKETGAAKKKKIIDAQASKKLQTTGRSRKALSDISNSSRLNLSEGPKKKSFAKLSVFSEEPIDACEVAGEQFLHNHRECIKAQSKAMDMDLFLHITGLDNDISKQQASPVPYQSSPRHDLLEDMAEELITEDESWMHEFSEELDSPPRLGSPKYYMDYDYMFELLGSP